MKYTYKFRIYPNREQEKQIQRTFGCCRYVYNHYLAKYREAYEQTGKTPYYRTCAADMIQLKNSLGWLCEVDATALQSSLRHLDTAYRDFYRQMRKGKTPSHPQFKSKREHRQRYTSKCENTSIRVLDKAVQLPMLGAVRCRVSKEVRGRIQSAGVSRNPSGQYYVSLYCTEVEPPASVSSAEGRALTISSDGIEYPGYTRWEQAEKRLARLQRQLPRKAKGSKRWEKARRQAARLYETIRNRRNDTLHKLSTEIIRHYDIVCIKDVCQSQRQGKSIADTGWKEFRRQLLYKAAWYGKPVIKTA